MVLPDVNGPAVGTRLRGVLDSLSLTGLDPVLLEVPDEDQGRDRFRRIAERGRSEGAVVIDLRPSTAENAMLRRAGARCVFVGRDVEGWPAAWAGGGRGTRVATEHLLGLGHREIAYLGESGTSGGSTRRLRGFTSAMTAAGMSPNRQVADRRSSVRRCHSRHGTHPRPRWWPDPIGWASSVLAEARRRGMRVPGDLSVVGFDGSDLARHVGLTTVGQQLAESGRWAVENLLALIAGSEAVPRHRLRIELVEGDSTGPI